MKLKSILLYIQLFFISSIYSKYPTLNDVRNSYLNLENLNMKAIKILKDSNKLNEEMYTCLLEMNRIDKKNFNFIYFDPISTCILKDESTNQRVKYFNRFEDSFSYFDFSNEEIQDCYQFTGVNISGFENPFSDCFYHSFNFINKTKLTDLGTSYFYNMNNNFNGFPKKIWINYHTLLVDSIYYSAGSTFKKIYYTYITSSKIPETTKHLNFNEKFDSLVFVLRSLNIAKTELDQNNINLVFKPAKLTLLDFWFIGCQPCLEGFPKLQNIRDSFTTEFLNILAINPADLEKNILYFKSKSNYTFCMANDSLNLNIYYNIRAYPTILLVDTDGSVIKRIEGNNKEKQLLELIDEIKKRQN